jgi:hypothetical protein
VSGVVAPTTTFTCRGPTSSATIESGETSRAHPASYQRDDSDDHVLRPHYILFGLNGEFNC